MIAVNWWKSPKIGKNYEKWGKFMKNKKNHENWEKTTGKYRGMYEKSVK